jgi:hypothetical protein
MSLYGCVYKSAFKKVATACDTIIRDSECMKSNDKSNIIFVKLIVIKGAVMKEVLS